MCVCVCIYIYIYLASVFVSSFAADCHQPWVREALGRLSLLPALVVLVSCQILWNCWSSARSCTVHFPNHWVFNTAQCLVCYIRKGESSFTGTWNSNFEFGHHFPPPYLNAISLLLLGVINLHTSCMLLGLFVVTVVCCNLFWNGFEIAFSLNKLINFRLFDFSCPHWFDADLWQPLHQSELPAQFWNILNCQHSPF